MVINTEKSYSILICNRQEIMHLESNHLDINCSGSLLNNVSYHKHFGIVMDDRLTWSQQISFSTNKMNLCLSVLYRIRSFSLLCDNELSPCIHWLSLKLYLCGVGRRIFY